MYAIERFKSRLPGFALCAMAAWAASGCSLLDSVDLTRPITNRKIDLGSGTLMIPRTSHDLDRYTCGKRGPVYCVAVGSHFSCQCADR